MALRTAFLWSMIGSLALAAALGIAAILFDGLGWVWEEILYTALLMGGCSTVALMCAFVQGRHPSRNVAGVCFGGMGSAGGAFVVSIILVWFYSSLLRSDDYLLKTALTLTVMSLWAAHLGLLALLPLDRSSGRMVRRGTLILAGGLSVSLIFLLWTDYQKDWFMKSLAIGWILMGSGSVVTPVLALIEWVKRRAIPGALLTESKGGARVVIRIVCPRCGSEEDMPVGRNHCGRCGLRITLDLEEPRCACGYLLYKLESDKCPECGRAVAAEERWGNDKEGESCS